MATMVYGSPGDVQPAQREADGDHEDGVEEGLDDGDSRGVAVSGWVAVRRMPPRA